MRARFSSYSATRRRYRGAAASNGRPCEDGDLGEPEVRDEDGDRDHHDGARGRISHTGRATSSRHAEVAADDGDDRTEKRCLEEAGEEVLHRDRGEGAPEKESRGDVELIIGD